MDCMRFANIGSDCHIYRLITTKTGCDCGISLLWIASEYEYEFLESQMSAAKKSGSTPNDAPTFDEISDESPVDLLDLEDKHPEESTAVPSTEDVVVQLVEVEAEHLARLELEAKDSYDKYLRAVAEFENYKKRMIRERADLLKYAGESLARDLLDVLDDLERAVTAASNSVSPDSATEGQIVPPNPADFIAGVKLIKDRFISIFDKHGIKGESAVGQPFDPNTHQALATVPVTEVEPNIVLNEFKKAYFFKDKLLRVGQVVVSAAPPEN